MGGRESASSPRQNNISEEEQLQGDNKTHTPRQGGQLPTAPHWMSQNSSQPTIKPGDGMHKLHPTKTSTPKPVVKRIAKTKSTATKRFRTRKRDSMDVSDQEKDDPFAKMQDFMRQQFSHFRSDLANVKYSVETLTQTVNSNSEQIRQLEKCVKDNRKRSSSNISDLQEMVV